MKSKKPVAWEKFLQNHDDDSFESLIPLLRYKVERLRWTMTYRAQATDFEKSAEEMKFFENLLTKVMEEDYADKDARRSDFDQSLSFLSRRMWNWWD